ncbi:hypothetical protein BGZ65_011480 [Modicella reniformis]|uniref:RRM domain-containing protein n=1 Tax=Modicella reniformis TaxID=1440133 RepID=A0A9P6IHM8_9FUNG|nr:hypothetical protein BGZ65_011480 [Modicella reniformis]
MVRPEDADAAMQVLNGFELHGRAMSVNMARRGRARTPTPGQYRGPPKRERGTDGWEEAAHDTMTALLATTDLAPTIWDAVAMTTEPCMTVVTTVVLAMMRDMIATKLVLNSALSIDAVSGWLMLKGATNNPHTVHSIPPDRLTD